MNIWQGLLLAIGLFGLYILARMLYRGQESVDNFNRDYHNILDSSENKVKGRFEENESIR